MSSFNLAKKLQPARKAWKSLRNRLQSKLRDSKLVIATITALGQRCSIAWQSIFRFLHRKVLGITKRAVPPRSHRHLHLYRHHVGHSYSPIYVDKLFPGLVTLAEPGKIKEGMAESSSTSVSDNKSRPGSAVETHRGGKIQIQDKVRAKIPGDDEKGSAPVGKGKAKLAGESSGSAEKWKLPMIPQFKGVDERAEEFIAKFRQDMKLEREQSILEFEEMLKRSA
ncbi:hypothetical protein Sango_0594900 [Sesamum angolense]|uniref:Uncharacterized protein n=1 Tax=Sesamum angolense TaxID=2727404 RepID=A0AAE1X6Z8_9LAMI|nr:hypothetical protein Sango_0594900 [Sesamum angolense]